MKILVINAGSSSLKYQLIDAVDEHLIARGNCQRIGIDGLISQATSDGRKFKSNAKIASHKEALSMVSSLLTDKKYGVIESLSEIKAVGHRVVQGAEKFKQSVIIDDKVLQEIDSLSPIAPLHNPVHVGVIKACQETFGRKIPQVAVFDTSFHHTIPEKAYIYGFPYEIYEKYNIRKYGFHGTSHKYVSGKAAKILGLPLKTLKLVSCHLGSGVSICAIDGGKSVDTTMGFTPLDGILMGTRSGSVDPSCVTFLMEKMGLGPSEMFNLMNKKSGLLGISGVSSDYRDLKAAATSGNKRARLAIDIMSYQVRKQIASCAAAMDGVDAIVFTGGIGENQSGFRKSVCDNLKIFGVRIDDSLNDGMIQGNEGIISSCDSKTAICVVLTDEELMIAKDALRLIQGKKCNKNSKGED